MRSCRSARKGGQTGKDNNGRERIGRYGWKADVAGLEEFVALAFRNEMGITSPLAPLDIAHDNSCGKARSGPDDDGSVIGAVTAYLLALPAPSPAAAGAAEPVAPGRHLFSSTGCVMCHTPVLESARGDVALYSDLLLHDMGPSLNDGIIQGAATGGRMANDAALGPSPARPILHDGRAETAAEAVLDHDGEGAAAARAFRQLPQARRETLLAFISTL